MEDQAGGLVLPDVAGLRAALALEGILPAGRLPADSLRLPRLLRAEPEVADQRRAGVQGGISDNGAARIVEQVESAHADQFKGAGRCAAAPLQEGHGRAGRKAEDVGIGRARSIVLYRDSTDRMVEVRGNLRLTDRRRSEKQGRDDPGTKFTALHHYF